MTGQNGSDPRMACRLGHDKSRFQVSLLSCSQKRALLGLADNQVLTL